MLEDALGERAERGREYIVGTEDSRGVAADAEASMSIREQNMPWPGTYWQGRSLTCEKTPAGCMTTFVVVRQRNLDSLQLSGLHSF